MLEPSEGVWQAWHDWLNADSLWPAQVALVHGDLHPGHLLLDEQARLVGILDWTEAKVTDPSLDLAMFFGCFGRPALDALLDRLRARGVQVRESFVEHIVRRWAAFPVLGAEWALRTNNPGALEMARFHLAQQSQ